MAQRTWFVTGVNSGFGRQLTEQLLERGDRVAGTVRKLDSVQDLQDKYGDQFWLAHLDVPTHRRSRRSSTERLPTSGRSTSSSTTPATACSARPRN